MESVVVNKISKLYGLARTFIPPLRDDIPRRKGFFGKIAVLGGSLEYTGAPYYSVMTALKMGYDIGHVFCTFNAAGPIKSYSPELIVHPILYSSSETHQVVSSVEESASAVISWLSRVDVVVVGPGLSRDIGTLDVAEKIIAHARSLQIPMILDADALVLVETNPDLIKGYPKCIITPNSHEFSRLLETVCAVYGSSLADMKSEVPVFNGHEPSSAPAGAMPPPPQMTSGGSMSSNPVSGSHGPSAQAQRVAECEHLAGLLGNVCVIYKAEEDVISNGYVTAICNARGSVKRSGGQGDVLAGAVAGLLGWEHKSQKRQADHGVGADLKHATESFETYIATARLAHLAPHGWWREDTTKEVDLTLWRRILAAAFGGCFLTRAFARDAFAQRDRSMSAPDMIDQVGGITKKLYFM